MAALDLRGHRYGRLVVCEQAERIGGQTAWNCVCDCGNHRVVRTRHLRHGGPTSCKECGLVVQRRGNPIHGMSRSHRPTLIVWHAIKARCLNHRHAAFHNYGGRGIKICDRWRDDFAAFIADVGPRPSGAHSIDRIDNDGDYTPENCRWATAAEQGNNRRDCYRIRHNGEVLSLAAFCRTAGLNAQAVYKRVERRQLGHDFDSAAIFAPIASSRSAPRRSHTSASNTTGR